jgi:TP901 family phage tail tape measure protein
MSGATTRKQIIEDDAILWGKEYATNVELAKNKNKEFVDSILLLNEANLKLRASRNDKEYQANQKITNQLGEKSISVWKEQNQAELALISTKRKNELATEGTNKALIKERTILSETNKEIKLQTRSQLGLIGTYEKLNRDRLTAQKTLANLLTAEKRNNAEIIVAQREFDKLDKRVKAVDAATKNYSKNIGNYQSAFQGLSGTLKDLVSAFGIVTGIALFAKIMRDTFNVVVEFDRQLIAVGKTTNIAGDDLKKFGAEVIELGGKLNGISIQGLLKSAEVAGTLGVKGTENILKFSTAIEKLKLTSDIISDEQVQNFAKFIQVSSDSFENADKLASVITQLGNNFATTEAQILGNATEIAKGVAVYNTSAEAILGIGAATSSLGSEAESSRSAIQSTFKVINDAVATGANLEKVLKLTGLTQQELSKQFNKDASGVFVKFVGGLAKAKDEGENLSKVLEEVEITEKRAFTVIGSLAANYDILTTAVSTAKQEYIDNIALNKEVAAASESVASILTDIKDKWEQYVLNTNNANQGTEKLASGLKFLRDNLQSIISNFIKYGSVLLSYLAIQRAVNFVTAAFSAIKTAATVAQINFALSTGIGTKAILAEAQAVRAATLAQTGLNTAMTATPWGIILAALAAVVVAYVVFNDELSETEKRVNAVRFATENLQQTESKYTSDRDKNREKDFKGIESEIELRKAKGESSKKLDEEEINRKKEIVKSQLQTFVDLKKQEFERTKNQIEESNKRVENAQKEFDAINKYALTNPFGESTKDKKNNLVELKSQNDALRATLKANSEVTISEQTKLNGILEDLDKQGNLKESAIQAEEDKKAIAKRKQFLKEKYDLEKKAIDEAFKLSQFRLQLGIDLDKEILDNEDASFEKRIDALLDSQQIYNTKIKEQAEYELSQLGKYNEDKGTFIRELSNIQIDEIIRTGQTNKVLTSEQQLVFEKYQESLTTAAKKGTEDREKLIDGQVNSIQKLVDAQIQDTDTALNNRISKENEQYQRTLDAAGNNYDLLENAAIEHERKLLKITQDFAKEKLQVQIDAIQTLLDNNALLPKEEQISAEKRAETENKLSKYKADLSQLNVDTIISSNEAIIESEKEKAERLLELQIEANQRTRELADNLAYSLVDLTNTIFDAKVSAIEAEMDYWNDYYDNQIELAGNDARQKDLLEKEKAKKAKELEKERKKELVKAAIFNKVISLAQIGIDLAKTLTAIQLVAVQLDAISFGTAGTPYRAIQIPIAIGIAAAQAANVLLAPLPKYKLGRKGGPEEMAIVGDGGVSEIITKPDGSNPIMTPNKPTLARLAKNDIVWKNFDEYKKYLNNSMKQTVSDDNKKLTEYQIMIQSGGFSDAQINKKLDEVVHAIKNKKSSTTIHNNIDFGYQQWRNDQINWRNKRR